MLDPLVCNNITGPQLALETVLPCLSWLPGEVASYAARATIDYLAFSTILNILLVFTGARTAALLDNLNSVYSPFIHRLNNALRETNQSAFRLDVDEFYMGDFVYRENNPRFIHSHAQRLRHREIGHNLDFFMPDNIDAIDDKIYISIHEMQTWVQVTGEVVAKRCIRSEKDIQRLITFTDHKVQSFNNAFQQLHLPYNFAWFYSAPAASLDNVMSNNTPPSRDWWDANWFNVAWSTVTHRPHLQHIFHDYEHNWGVITTIWKFEWTDLWMRHDEDFRRRLEAVYNQVGDYISRGIPVDIDDLSLSLGKMNEEGRVEMMKLRKRRRNSERLETLRILTRVVRGEVGNWVNGLKRGNKRIEVIGGVTCSQLEDENYWSFMIRRLARIIRYGIFG